MHLTTHFTLEEFLASEAAARLGIDNTPDAAVIENLQRLADFMEEIRLYFGLPIHITSGYRCPELNAAVHGSTTSAHRFGLAGDFHVQGRDNMFVAREISSLFGGWDQIIYEFGPVPRGWVHVGLSMGPPRGQLLTAVRRDGKTVYLPGLHGI